MKQKISAYILLAVFLPMLLLSSLHVHELTGSAESSCIECVHHQCSGHLTQLNTHLYDCVLCQFLTLPMLVAAMVALVLLLNKGLLEPTFNLCRLASITCGTISLRAPPICLIK